MIRDATRNALAIGAVADVLGVSGDTIRRMLSEGVLEGYTLRHSGHRRIYAESVRDYIGDEPRLIKRLESKLAKRRH